MKAFKGLQERIKGCVYGTAIGDALGYPVEFDKNKLPVTEKDMPLQYSDDTQMMIACCLGLLRFDELHGPNANGTPWDMADTVAEQFVLWHCSQDDPMNRRAPGNTCMASCQALRRGVHWSCSGRPSNGCGTAMRSMAYGMWYPGQIGKAIECAALHATITHTGEIPEGAAAIVAAITSASLVYDPEEYRGFDWMRDAYNSALWHYPTYPNDKQIGAVLRRHYAGWTGEEAVWAALAGCQMFPESFKDAVLWSVNHTDDSDSAGAIAGAFMGARLGVKSIPESWMVQVENRLSLMRLANDIYDNVMNRIEAEENTDGI